MVYNKQKKTHKSKINKFLVSISFIGSAGPIRFVVKEDETVSHVIEYALKCYAREGSFHFSDQIPVISYFTVLTVQLKVRSKVFHQNPFEFFTVF